MPDRAPYCRNPHSVHSAPPWRRKENRLARFLARILDTAEMALQALAPHGFPEPGSARRINRASLQHSCHGTDQCLEGKCVLNMQLDHVLVKKDVLPAN